MHPSIVPYVENATVTSATDDDTSLTKVQLTNACIGALKRLIQDGCKADEQHARAALLLTERPVGCVAGRERRNVKWGGGTQCVDYNAQSIQIGNLAFPAVDVGGAITLSLSTQKALRTPSREGTNQCVLLHLAAVGGWKSQGCPKRVPHKTRVVALASHFRQYEYRQACGFANQIKKPSSHREYELWSVAHDAMAANRDRQFREIPVFLTGILNLGKCATLGIFEVKDLPSGRNVSVHQMGKSSDNDIDEDMTLLVYSGHMRMLLPAPETTIKEWKGWQTQVNRAHLYERIGWETILPSDESPPSFFTSEPCAVCGQNAR